MGQLIKLENYVSRYQRDMFHYPAQYIRLKQENWQKLLYMWETEMKTADLEAPFAGEEKRSMLDKWRDLFKREEVELESTEMPLPQTMDKLKQFFLDSIFQFQLNWASTTISEMSFIDRIYYDDFTLKYFLQRFPDTYLMMYKPIFKLKKAVVDADIIMITPVEIGVIKLVEQPSDQTIIVGDDRSWLTEKNNVRTKFLSPMLSLKRTAKIVKSILDHHQLDMPIKKIVLSRTNQMDYNLEPFETTFIDREKHEVWVQQQRQFSSPLKHQQLKVSNALLSHSDTVSVHRPEWDRTKDDEF